MNFSELSTKYVVRALDEKDVDSVYLLCKGNPMYCEYMNEQLTKESVRKTMTMLPPGKLAKDKVYLGYYEANVLVATLELVLAYPDEETVLLGFFMVNAQMQARELGSNIIKDLFQFVKNNGYHEIILSYVEGNGQSKRFLEKNFFIETGEIDDFGDIRMIKMIKTL